MTVMADISTESPSTTNRRLRVIAAIPAFNEADTIGQVVENAMKYVDEVVVIDDGSTDSTGEIALGKGALVLRHRSNFGYGAALATGLRHMRENGSDILVTLDADGQHEPAEIPKLVQPIAEGRADVVTGSRFLEVENGPPIPAYRKFGISVVNRAWKLASGGTLTDTQCGFRAYSRNAVNRIDIKQANMSASLEILDRASKSGMRIVEVPVSVKYGKGTSTMEPGRHGLELVNYVLRKLREEHPLLIFGGVGMGLSISGIIFAALALNSYLQGGSLPFGPTILAAVFIYVGTLMIFGGLILNSIQALADRVEKVNRE